MEDAAWVIFFLVLIVLFAGEPDFHDILIKRYANTPVPLFESNEQAADALDCLAKEQGE